MQIKNICHIHFNNYYLFTEIFPRFWLVKATRIIQHNQLLLTKFGKNYVVLNQWRETFCHIQPITSKYLQKCSPLQGSCRLLNRWPRNPGDEVVLFWWVEKQRAKWRNSFKNRKIFWMNNKASIELSFRRVWRILQISESVIHRGRRPCWIWDDLLCVTWGILGCTQQVRVEKLFY